MQAQTSFGVVFALWAAGLGAAAQFGKVSVVYPLLADHYGQGGAALGFAVSLVGFVGIFLGVVAGLLAARVGYRWALMAALGLGAAASLYQASLPPLPLLLASRVAEGMSHLAIVVSAPTLIAQLSAPRHRGFTLSLWSTFFGVAFALLVWLGLPLARSYGVAALFLAHGGYMAAMALLIAISLPRDVVGPGAQPLTLPGILRDHVDIYRSPWRNAAALGWVCYAGAFVAMLTILPPFLPDTTRGTVIGAMPLAGIASSMLLGVWLMRFLPAVRIIRAGFAASLGFALILWWDPSQGWPYLAMAAAMGLVQGASFALVPVLNAAPRAQAQANGAIAQMGNVGTTLGTPVLAALTLSFGINGFLAFAVTLFTAGFVVHGIMARRRSRSVV